MRFLALLVALFVMVVGVAGVVSPESLLAVGRYVVTPVGIYLIAALRVGIGLLLMLVAGTTRAPRIVRTLGAFVFVAGIVTPLFGVDRSRAILDWEAMHGTAPIRVGAVLALALGGYLAYVVGAGRPVARS